MLVLGPVLRHVAETTAQVWVQTDRAATVRVLGCATRTFEVSGHHFALVAVTGLVPDSTVPYQVHVDDVLAWPLPDSPFPDSVVRTRGPGGAGQLRVIFGSCRYAKVPEPRLAAQLGVDALDAYATRMARRPPAQWPDALLLLGDQVYADELTSADRARITGDRTRHPEWPDDEIVGFEEYVELYRRSWSDREIRWLLSTIPTAMIFDDHDVRDDWNTSAVWRAQMRATSWWPTRIRSALVSYWVFQHIGNLPPEELAADRDHADVLAAAGDAWPVLAEMAQRADVETDGEKGVRFSFRWDLGRSRLIMIDSRNGRILDDGQHLMLGESEFSWIEAQARAPGEIDHLLLGTSLPWLMPHAIGELETVNEIAAARPGRRGRLAETIRQAADLEHWAAFRASFDRLARLIETVAGSGVASVSVLSGDVHHSYAARADLPSRPAAGVHQLTCSPVHNKVDWYIKPGFRLGWSRFMRRLTEDWSRRAGAPEKPVDWEKVAGPMFGNTLATLDISGRRAEVLFEQPVSHTVLAVRARLTLTSTPVPPGTPTARSRP